MITPILEIICDEALKPRSTATLAMVGVIQDAKFNMYGDALKKTPQGAPVNRTRASLAATKARMERCMKTSKSAFDNQWYAQKLKEIEQRLSALPVASVTSADEAPDVVSDTSADGFTTMK